MSKSTEQMPCKECGGSGQVGFGWTEDCESCGGTGSDCSKFPIQGCAMCGGSGSFVPENGLLGLTTDRAVPCPACAPTMTDLMISPGAIDKIEAPEPLATDSQRGHAINSLLVAVAHSIAALKNGGGTGHVIVELEDALHRFGASRT